jgi:isopenicillin-N N-acyltransferase-like protein
MRYSYSTGQRRVLLNYPGWIGNIGLTSDGMSFAGTSLYGQSPAGETVPYSLLKRMALESKNVGEFLNGIEGLTFENGCFVIGDKTGQTVCIECVAGKQNRRDVSGMAFAHANSILSNELKGLEDKVLGSPSSPTRQKQMQHQLDEQRGAISVDGLKKMMADHTEYPRSVCLHSHDGEPHHTTAAFIANLSDLAIDIAIGNPCEADFVRFVLPD